MYEWVDHTSEIELRVRAASAEDVVAEATAALGELLGEAAGDQVRRNITVAAADAAGLLAAWLEEVVFLAEHEGLVPEGARGLVMEPDALVGELIARRGQPAHLVKAVTYHRLALAQDDDGWWGRAVLDV